LQHLVKQHLASLANLEINLSKAQLRHSQYGWVTVLSRHCFRTHCARATCGLTPISRRGVKTANESLVVLATIVSMVPRCIARLAPVSSLHWLRTESRQTPIRFKRYADCAGALVASPPQKNVGPASRPRVLLTVQWLPNRLAPVSSWLATRATRIR